MSAITAAPPLLTAIGHDAPRIDAVAKVTGEAQFAGDLRLHGMAYGRLLRSPYAHARITDIDTSHAEALPGVIAVMTGRDLPATDPYYGHALKDRPILAINRVRFVGEPVIAVAAESPAIAGEAITLIDVAYEELPAVVTIDRDHGRKLFVRDVDEGDGLAGDCRALRGHGDDRLAHEADAVDRQDRSVLQSVTVVGVGRGQIAASHHRDHAGERLGMARIDIGDAGVGVRATQKPAVGHPVQA